MESQRKKYLGIGAAITFLLSTPTLIPFIGGIIGVVLSPLAGFIGGGVAVYLLGYTEPVEGIKDAAIAVAVGWALSAVVGISITLVLNVVLASGGAESSIVGALVSIAFGLVFGFGLTVVPGVIGGALATVVNE